MDTFKCSCGIEFQSYSGFAHCPGEFYGRVFKSDVGLWCYEVRRGDELILRAALPPDAGQPLAFTLAFGQVVAHRTLGPLPWRNEAYSFDLPTR